MAAERTVLMMAGGTGGHVFPALAVAKTLAERDVDVHWLGTAVGIEARLVPAAGLPLHCLNMAGVRGKNPLFRLLAILKAAFAVLQSMRLILRLKPFCVVGMGGYASGPGGLAAKLLGVPLVIQEQNAVAGTTNRLLAKIATLCLTGYPIDLGGTKNRYIGNPVRREIAITDDPAVRWAERNGPLRVLVLGGSLGAKPINDVVLQTWQELSEADRPLLWHQTGRTHESAVQSAYMEAGIEVLAEAFIDDMAAAYSWADIVICRAGALTVAELAAAGVPAVLIPLPHAIDDHQRANAKWFAGGGAGEIIDQKDFSVAALITWLKSAKAERATLLVNALAARQLAKVDAANVAADFCMEYCHES
ncbi:UDP-N-acetylglucosamine--N-acetylmuramyl-(pentapeptide) pyrophosphoryl-undecaprenol N-acetylglucosamine transferase [Zhongshania aliphaticivorans]|uniref:UDP-N-acetylglucosamine--N-acetylmuramyl-(pentapeptide) pyrophosphoryl-undecaprenol N-acetylglucosamine transferase n=2 Tax=Zhongshania aliphaticivorans TaxID=1470434 RepID=A0A5S9N140_9GAMM|nr:UDP-N-acetylglucosamine--N-acetylmuramyl-(pentapeptide) pyrophosphoryl-undecaprenol N-acetylglucosamine transferase [Zhongshania aliphaticivorans]CAA0083642.1 UDP-N-acetylglucosamine--N-acetylmuramyl-(pentapeptide) pyrophosphoryl-undecaprenol N-acetylglucosamine transferase [Zhongshania aliphaticivorans]